MKVKVSYTIDLDDIPNKVREIVKKNDETIKEMCRLSEEIATGDLGAKSLQNLTRMKEMCEDLRERYSDSESILAGFLQAVFSPSQEEETQENLSNDDNS
tara:strand:+ start:323 stop:622 length:300 start_codon:yes stop_codon:yes gene_type:complete